MNRGSAVSGLDFNDLERRMSGAIDILRKEFGGLRTGRASTSLLEPVTVDAYGSKMHLSQVASVSVSDPRMLTVQVWDRGLQSAVEKAIRDANLGLNPMADSGVIRVPIPELTHERRVELGKAAGRYAEQARVSVRNVRREGMDRLKKLEKDGEISEDQHRDQSHRVQQLTDRSIAKIDELAKAKDAEIMQV